MTAGGLLAHRVEGEGPPLLLLNGGLMTYAAWEPVAAPLRERHQLVLCDLRGQLRSPGAAPRHLAGNVDDLTALLDHLEIPSAHVLGTSYGGEIALLLAALRPERVRSLVAVTVSDHASDAVHRGIAELRSILGASSDPASRARFHQALVADVYSQAFKERYAEELAARTDQVAALPPAWFADLDHILGALEGFDLRPQLGAIRCPTLVVIAAHDQVMPPARSRALAAAIAGAEVRVHEASGHALVAEDPAWLAQTAGEFFTRHAASDPSPA